MAIADRINEMYTHVGDVYDTITNVDLPTNKNIQNIPQTIKVSYLEIMNNGIDRIWNNWEKVTGSGTSISLSPTLKAPMKNELKGNTSQTGAPTPTSPIPVNVVSGDNEISITGKNLFDKTRLISGKRLDNTGLPSIPDNTYCTTDYFIKVEPNTTYYSTSTINQSKAVCFYDSGQTFIERKMYLNAHTFTTGTTTQFIKISILLSEIDTEQLEKGSTATTYEPYQGNTYNIDLPVENLLDITKNTLTKGGLTITPNSDGSLTITGTTTGAVNAILVNSSNPPVLNAGTYTRSVKVVGTLTKGNTSVVIMGRDSNNVNAMGDISISENTTSSRTTTLTETHTMSVIGLFIGGAGVVFDCTIYIMLEKGSNVNSYVSYGTTPIELCKIGNYQDYFYKDSDKWYLHKEIGKVVLNGSENISIYNQNTNRTNFQVDILTGIENYLGGNNVPNLLSNMFNVASQSATWTVGNISRRKEAQTTLYLTYEPSTTIDQFKAWLSTHNVVVYYVLATPVNTALEDM